MTSKIKYKIARRWCTLFWVTRYQNRVRILVIKMMSGLYIRKIYSLINVLNVAEGMTARLLLLYYLYCQATCQSTIGAGSKAASQHVNCDCQCSSLTFRDSSGVLQGNCNRLVHFIITGCPAKHAMFFFLISQLLRGLDISQQLILCRF